MELGLITAASRDRPAASPDRGVGDRPGGRTWAAALRPSPRPRRCHVIGRPSRRTGGWGTVPRRVGENQLFWLQGRRRSGGRKNEERTLHGLVYLSISHYAPGHRASSYPPTAGIRRLEHRAVCHTDTPGVKLSLSERCRSVQDTRQSNVCLVSELTVALDLNAPRHSPGWLTPYHLD